MSFLGKILITKSLSEAFFLIQLLKIEILRKHLKTRQTYMSYNYVPY